MHVEAARGLAAQQLPRRPDRGQTLAFAARPEAAAAIVERSRGRARPRRLAVAGEKPSPAASWACRPATARRSAGARSTRARGAAAGSPPPAWTRVLVALDHGKLHPQAQLRGWTKSPSRSAVRRLVRCWVRRVVVELRRGRAHAAKAQHPHVGDHRPRSTPSTVWVPVIRSRHATCPYSWISPPRRSRRTTLPGGARTTGTLGSNGAVLAPRRGVVGGCCNGRLLGQHRS